ncbi:alkylhydroperoxidase [Vandammella animalimorsus]|uniref:Alkylhydroperoxidase n=1 Tax=Vandammella animalimorsus TaxID=2029117 RepID=A0A2A2A8T4_9BURK|nr:carboxymuconolactone decarboxylase family protein [Vandammella animalimorsus]PAT31668.1 alkylhydroperoxidase [Vandammella animalimorsus]PAT34182.1 alkylhydroperoxidase [Vandammella animalimorsus]PAT39810.1 alkylhydroperoxidase [Vandammella animalimorsus]PAX16236.1 alkylhydroperoxidase [Vandammella animalimorsus]PAX18266.1 alkylhydroperoxidase [Vandammella animalimorsus]
MSKSYREIIEHTSSWLAPLRKDMPDTMKGFGALSQAALADGALDKKTKELIALALGVAARCDPCLGYHAKALVQLGCTRAELLQMLGMCVYMGGGPSLMYAANALAAYEEFGGEKAQDAAQ